MRFLSCHAHSSNDEAFLPKRLVWFAETPDEEPEPGTESLSPWADWLDSATKAVDSVVSTVGGVFSSVENAPRDAAHAALDARDGAINTVQSWLRSGQDQLDQAKRDGRGWAVDAVGSGVDAAQAWSGEVTDEFRREWLTTASGEQAPLGVELQKLQVTMGSAVDGAQASMREAYESFENGLATVTDWAQDMGELPMDMLQTGSHEVSNALIAVAYAGIDLRTAVVSGAWGIAVDGAMAAIGGFRGAEEWTRVAMDMAGEVLAPVASEHQARLEEARARAKDQVAKELAKK